MKALIDGIVRGLQPAAILKMNVLKGGFQGFYRRFIYI